MANLRANNLTGTGGRNAIDGSLFFNGTEDSLGIPSIALGSGNWTIEFWFYSTKESSQDCHIYDGRGTGSASSAYPIIKFDTDEKLSFYTTGAIRIQGASVVELGSWNHVALVKNSSTTTLYLNGQSEGTYSDSNTYLAPSNSIGRIGSDDNGSGYFFYGFLSNYRFVKGTAVYTAAFTPPTEKLTAVENTVLLCCQDSDNPTQEATGKTITGYGKLDRIGIGTAANVSSSDWMQTGDQDMTITGRSYMTTGGANPSGVSKRAMLPLDTNHNYSWYVNVTTVSDNVGFRGYYGGTAQNLPSSPGYMESTGEYSGVVGAGATAVEFIVWQNDSAVLEGINVVKLDPGKAPKVLPQVGIDEGVTFEGDTKVNTQGYMYFPTGDTSQRGRGRGLIIAGYTNPVNIKTTDYIQIQTLGNAIKFGDATALVRGQDAAGSSTRAVSAGGFVAPGIVDTIEYFTTATTSNAVDFGNLVSATSSLAGFGNETRGIWAGGYVPSASDKIDYVTIATTGNAADFGNCVANVATAAGCASPTRGVFGGGYASPAGNNTLQYVTIATTGNATDFGDLTAVTWGLHALSSNTRGVFGGGVAPSITNTISYVTIASTGNAADFGDLIQTASYHACTSNGSRGIFAGGDPTSTFLNTIQYVTIATTGNASDFGDMTTIGAYRSATSDSHGGLS